ncbi:MAG: CAP domain-containing protein [Acidobacteriota bacterium]|nr:CAP domain-containing protein [Acidobacteriota bacterium]
MGTGARGSVLLFLVLATALGGGVISAEGPLETAFLEKIRVDLVAHVNHQRLLAGLEPFARAPALDRAAQQVALNMSKTGSSTPGGSGPSGLSTELQGWLVREGYDARRAVVHAVFDTVTGLETRTALEDLLFASESQGLEGGLLDPRFHDLGIGLAGSGDLQIVVLVSALSMAGEFEALTEPLDDIERVREELLELSNSARRDKGRRVLQRDRCLEGVAQLYADKMLAKSFYGHVSPDGLDAFERARAGRCFNPRIAENLAQGSATVEETIGGWLASPGHRTNLLDRRMNRVGFGVASGTNEEGFRILWVQVLGSS